MSKAALFWNSTMAIFLTFMAAGIAQLSISVPAEKSVLIAGISLFIFASVVIIVSGSIKNALYVPYLISCASAFSVYSSEAETITRISPLFFLSAIIFFIIFAFYIEVKSPLVKKIFLSYLTVSISALGSMKCILVSWQSSLFWAITGFVVIATIVFFDKIKVDFNFPNHNGLPG